jgi:hypothetical protein
VDAKELQRLAKLGIESELERLNAALAQLSNGDVRTVRRGRPPKAEKMEKMEELSAAPVRRRRKMSAAARQLISERMKAHWAGRRGESTTTRKPKRT